MALIPFPEYRPDVDDFRGNHTQVLSGVIPRADGWGPVKDIAAYSEALGVGNDSFTKVLLHFDGADAATTITDSNAGGSAHTWTAAGNAQIDTAIYKFGGASGLFDGTGDYVSTPDHADFTLGSGDWTIDCWFKCEAASGSNERLAGQGDNAATSASTSFRIQRASTDFITMVVCSGGTPTVVTSTTKYTSALNTGWHHFAGVRTGNILRMFIDGVQEGTDTAFSGSVNDSSNEFAVGRAGELTTDPWTGSIDEFRLSVGIARWTTAFNEPGAPYMTAAQGACRGAFHARKEDGTIVVFAATADRLLKLNNTTLQWDDVSKLGVAYTALPSTDQWQFAQFNDSVIAVQVNATTPQVFDIASPALFTDLGGSPPAARYVAVVGRFLVLTGLTGEERRVHWSDLDGITTWTAGTGFANYVNLPDGGITRGVAGGEFGVILQESAVRRMIYVPGAKPAFQIERIEEEVGLLAPYSIVRAGSRVFFLSTQGFKAVTASGPTTPIGKERIDRTFRAALDATALQLMIGAADPGSSRVVWSYKSTAGASTTAFDMVQFYDWALDRWSPPIPMAGQYISSFVKPGITLEGLDSISGSIDALPSSLDAIQSALLSELCCFNTSDVLCTFSGSNLEAILETPEQGQGQRSIFVRGLTPRTDATDVRGSIRFRASAQAALSQTAEATINVRGLCPVRKDAKLQRGRIRIPAGTAWTYASGVEPEFKQTGSR